MQNKIDIKAYLSAADRFWIGGQLRSLRQAQGRGVPEAARLINGTQSQILAIESGSQGPFGSTENYVQGVLTYAALNEIAPDSPLGIKLAELQSITTGAIKEPSSASGIDSLIQSSLTSVSSGSTSRALNGKRLLGALLGISAIIFVIVFALDLLPFTSGIRTFLGISPSAEKTEVVTTTSPVTLLTQNAEGSSPTTQPSPIVTTARPPVKAEPEAKNNVPDSTTSASKPIETDKASAPVAPPSPSPETRPVSGQSLSLSFSGPCWIQTTDLEGKVSEKIYNATERLALDPAKLKALIIGNIDAVTMVDAKGKAVSLSAFANQSSKVARFKEQELGALTRDRN